MTLQLHIIPLKKYTIYLPCPSLRLNFLYFFSTNVLGLLLIFFSSLSFLFKPSEGKEKVALNCVKMKQELFLIKLHKLTHNCLLHKLK